MAEKSVKELEELARKAAGPKMPDARVVKRAEPRSAEDRARELMEVHHKVLFYSKCKELSVKTRNGRKAVDQNNRVVEFPPQRAVFDNCLYTCTDAEELKTLLASESFGRIFWLAEDARKLQSDEEKRRKREDTQHRRLQSLEIQGLGGVGSLVPEQTSADSMLEDGGQ